MSNELQPIEVVMPGGIRWLLGKEGAFRERETPFMKFRTLDVAGFNNALDALPSVQAKTIEVYSKTIFDVMTPKVLGQAAKYLLEKGDQHGEVEVLIKWGVHRKTGELVLGVPKQVCSGASVDAEDEELAELFGTNGVRQMGTIHTHPSECVVPSSTDVESWTTDDAGLHYIIGRPSKKDSLIVPMAAYMTVLGESREYHKACEEVRQLALVDYPDDIFWMAHPEKDLITTWGSKSYSGGSSWGGYKSWWNDYEWEEPKRDTSSWATPAREKPTDPAKMNAEEWLEWAREQAKGDKLSRKQRKKLAKREAELERRRKAFDDARDKYNASKEVRIRDSSLFSEAEYQASKGEPPLVRGVGSGTMGRYETLQDARNIMAGRHGMLVEVSPAEMTAMYGEIYGHAYEKALEDLSRTENSYRGAD